MVSPAIIPVIHYADDNQAMRNAERAVAAGCDGVFLIDMKGINGGLSATAATIKRLWPSLSVGINRLGEDVWQAVVSNFDARLDWTWTDDQLTHSGDAMLFEAGRTARLLETAVPHALFCAVAFKYQPHEPDPAKAARRAIRMGFIPTTSGPATGHEADPDAIAAMREAIGPNARLALASGITPDNAAFYFPHLTHALVSTGVSSSFHEFDPALLRALIAVRDSCPRAGS